MPKSNAGVLEPSGFIVTPGLLNIIQLRLEYEEYRLMKQEESPLAIVVGFG
jgi:hypothetical protein